MQPCLSRLDRAPPSNHFHLRLIPTRVQLPRSHQNGNRSLLRVPLSPPSTILLLSSLLLRQRSLHRPHLNNRRNLVVISAHLQPSKLWQTLPCRRARNSLQPRHLYSPPPATSSLPGLSVEPRELAPMQVLAPKHIRSLPDHHPATTTMRVCLLWRTTLIANVVSPPTQP